MANEPETLAAMCLCEHAVLIGDHMQLQPVVKYFAARECGLNRSLFQRYAEQDNELLTRLDIQYRMVSALKLHDDYISLLLIIIPFLYSILSYVRVHPSYFIMESLKLISQ